MMEYISQILKRKDLLFYLVKSGLKAENRNSYLGYFWWLLDPLLNVLVYYFLVVVILDRGGENYPLYLVIGLISWRWFNGTVNTSAKAITKYRSIINQVNLPKSIFPLASSLTQLFNYIFGLLVIAIFLLASQTMPGWQVIYLPLIILVQLIASVAVSLLISYLTVFVRDIDNMLTHIMRLVFYASPIIWVGGRLPDKYDWIVSINPVAIIIESYRDVLMHHQTPPVISLLVIGVIALLLGMLMLRHYQRNEHKIIKAL